MSTTAFTTGAWWTALAAGNTNGAMGATGAGATARGVATGAGATARGAATGAGAAIGAGAIKGVATGTGTAWAIGSTNPSCKIMFSDSVYLLYVFYLVDVLRESLQRDGSEAALSGDEVPEGGGQRSGHWAVIDIGGGQGQLGVSLGLSLVQTVDRLVTGAGQSPSIAGGVVRSVEVGVAVGGVVVQRICFRLSQDKRGYGENSDLKEV